MREIRFERVWADVIYEFPAARVRCRPMTEDNAPLRYLRHETQVCVYVAVTVYEPAEENVCDVTAAVSRTSAVVRVADTQQPQ